MPVREAEAGRLGQFIFFSLLKKTAGASILLVEAGRSWQLFLAKKRPCGGESPLTIISNKKLPVRLAPTRPRTLFEYQYNTTLTIY